MNVCKCHRHLDTIHISPLFEYHRAIFPHACKHTQERIYVYTTHSRYTYCLIYGILLLFSFVQKSALGIAWNAFLQCAFPFNSVPFYSNIFCFHILLFAPTASLACTSGENFLNCLIVYSLIRFSTGSYCCVCVFEDVCVFFFPFGFDTWSIVAENLIALKLIQAHQNRILIECCLLSLIWT